MGSMLLMGTSSLVLATETVIGEYSAEAVDMTNAVFSSVDTGSLKLH